MSAAAGKHSNNLLYRLAGFAGNCRKFFRHRRASGCAGASSGISGGDGKGILFTAGKTAGAAVGAGQSFLKTIN
jgi:hypothetical protein